MAGTASGVGKTTVATGIMAALRRRGVRVAAAKVGPDFIDPGYHALATGRPPRNLDPWMCGESIVAPLAARAGRDADILVIEGVMGLFDGVGASSVGGTAHVAQLLAAPVLLVVDAAAMAGSVAAVVHGFASFDPGLDIAGVILNRVGSDSHEQRLREALAPAGIPVLGALRRDPALHWRDRHLGLVPVVEQRASVEDSLDRLAAAVAAQVDLDGIMRLATAAAPRTTGPPPTAAPGGRCRLAVADGAAFSFSYTDNLELLAEAGAEIVPFDPLHDAALPSGVSGLVVGGGFPEVYAAALADNVPLLADTRRRVTAGLVTWAECGGLLWMGRHLDRHPLCGVIEISARMTGRLTLGYRTATFRRSSPLGPAGTVVRGHEFHYSAVEPAGDALCLTGHAGTTTAGWAWPTFLGSYLHLHLAGAPELATSLVHAASG